MALRCRCPYAGHNAGCKVKSIHDERGRLYDSQARRIPSPGSRVQLLNPGYNDGDATSRRFALLEID